MRPDEVIVDHLAFSARLALGAAGIPHADVVLGHPSALPVGDEVYGYPPAWPAAFTPGPADLAALHRLCREVRDDFTAEWNAALHVLAPGATPSADAFAEHGDLLLLNYPAALHDPARTALLPPHAFLGSAVRAEPADDEVRDWLAADDRPVVYVSFGSFLSVRGDVLARVLAALRPLGVRVAMATGSADRPSSARCPPDWLVRDYLPQVALLQPRGAAVTHGGNNSVTEALTAGVPMLVLPFSTDQFAGAAAIEAAGSGGSARPERGHVRGPGYRRARRPRRPCPAPGPHDRRGATPGTGPRRGPRGPARLTSVEACPGPSVVGRSVFCCMDPGCPRGGAELCTVVMCTCLGMRGETTAGHLCQALALRGGPHQEGGLEPRPAGARGKCGRDAGTGAINAI